VQAFHDLREVFDSADIEQQDAGLRRSQQTPRLGRAVRLPDRRFAVENLADLLEQPVITGDREDLEALRTRRSRPASVRRFR
jgi:hypothetical protein